MARVSRAERSSAHLPGHGKPTNIVLPTRALLGFYGHRLGLYRRTVPHGGFQILRNWAANMQHRMAVVTSNLDGQFQNAGFNEHLIAERHGSIHVLQCAEVCCDLLWPADGVQPIVDETTCELASELPRCPHCDALARPNIVMFGDFDRIALRTEQQEARLHSWLSAAKRLVVVEIGAGKAIPTVRAFSERNSTRVIRINPRDWGIASSRGVGLARGALEGLMVLDEALSPY